MLVSEAILETRRQLGGQRERRNRLAAAVTTPGQPSITLDLELAGIAHGAFLELRTAAGEELLYVWSVNAEAKTVQVGRGENGAPLSSAPVGSTVTVQPRYPTADIRRALTEELASLPASGLHRRAAETVTYSRTAGGFDIADVPDLLSPYALEVAVGDGTEWLYDWRRDGSILKPLSAPLGEGEQALLHYRAALGPLPADGGDLAEAGVPESAHDILPLGAALRLLAGKEAGRIDMDAQTTIRRADEVPVGSHTGLLRLLASQRADRLRAEALRQRQTWPARQR